jgi:hypothetical protein
MQDSACSPTESRTFGMSVRALLALLLVVTVCLVSIGGAVFDILHGNSPTVGESLQSMTLVAIGFFFGQKSTPTP